jgi:hypothetical protein
MQEPCQRLAAGEMAENQGCATLKVFQMHSWCAAKAQERAKMSAGNAFVT